MSAADLSGFEWLVHAVKLSEDCPAGPIPFPRPLQAVLVGTDGPPQNLLKEWVICEEEPQKTWPYSNLSSYFIHVGNKVHLQGCQLGHNVAVRRI